MAHHISCLQVIDSNSMNKIIRTLKPSLRTPSKLLSCLICKVDQQPFDQCFQQNKFQVYQYLKSSFHN